MGGFLAANKPMCCLQARSMILGRMGDIASYKICCNFTPSEIYIPCTPKQHTGVTKFENSKLKLYTCLSPSTQLHSLFSATQCLSSLDLCMYSLLLAHQLRNTNISSFLPYTVKFEITSTESATESVEDLPPALETALADDTSRTLPIASSILPSLSQANVSTQKQNVNTPPPFLKNREPSAQNFFRARNPSETNTRTLHDKGGPHLIQPKPRFESRAIPSLLIEPKKKKEDLGISGLTYNKSSTNLARAALTKRSDSLPQPDFAPAGPQRTRSSFGRFGGYLLDHSSNSSLAVTEDEDSAPPVFHPGVQGLQGSPIDDEDEETFTDEPLAPYGGFSRPGLEDAFMNQRNVFENAPWRIVPTESGNGSLYKAVDSAEKSNVIKPCKWVGTLSSPMDAIPHHIYGDICENLSEEFDCEAVPVTDSVFQGHYKSFCKQILWPTLHYQIPDDPKSKVFEEHSYKHYKKVNQLIADRIVEAYKKYNSGLDPSDPNNMIWIHDYHLFLVPAMVREQLPDAKIGFFLHVSFPSSEVFRCLAQRESLLRGILGADCVTFQTEEYVRHFLQTGSRLLLADTNADGIIHSGIFTCVNSLPVGIDAYALHDELKKESVVNWEHLIRERWRDQILLVSRDKLDKLRGIKQKLLAYETFLKNNPQYIEKTVLVEIFIGSSSNSDYKAEVMLIVSRINSLAENISIAQPVEILEQDVDFEQYLALQHEAAVFIVASCREGLNLTCHEFIEATSDKKSPLILSEFTGSSHILSCDDEGALLINPWDIRSFSNTIERALTMSESEKQKRWENCHEVVLKHKPVDWIQNCLKSIDQAWKTDHLKTQTNKKPFNKAIFDNFYDSTDGHRLFIINIDTTYSYQQASQKSTKGFENIGRISNTLTNLTSDPKNYVFVISILTTEELELKFKNVPNLGLIAESGGFIRLAGNSKWISIIDKKEVENWMSQVTLLVKSKAERLPKTTAIVEECTVRWIADSAVKEDPKRSLDAMGDIIQHINEIFEETEGVHATLIGNSVVVQQKNISIRAIDFLIACYTTSVPAANLAEQFQVKRVASYSERINTIVNSPLAEKFDWFDDKNVRSNKAKALLYSGGLSPIDEAIYEYASSLEKDNVLDSTISVAITGGQANARSSALYSVLGGNELLSIVTLR